MQQLGGGVGVHIALGIHAWVCVDGPYNKDSIVKTSGSRGVYDKFHAHF
jgi:hypothetical protein